MPGKELELSIAIGGYLYPQLGKSINRAKKDLDALGVQGTETQKKLEAIGTLTRNQMAMESQTKKLKEAIRKLNTANEELANSDKKNESSQTKLTRKRDEAAAKVAQLTKKTRDLSNANQEYKKRVEALYGPIGKLKASEDALRTSKEKMIRLQLRQADLDAAREKRTQRMYAAQMRITAATRIASVMQGPVRQAMEGEDLNFRLGTVINVPEKHKKEALRKARGIGAELAKAGYASYAETQDIQYALNSAGLTASLARSATKTVASVSKVTNGSMEQVSEVMATAYNNLGTRLNGSDEQKFSRIGDLLAKIQFKYQIRDFGQLGESMKRGSVAISQYNAQLEQSLTAIGLLNSAGLQGGEAGTAYYAMLKGFMKTAQDIPSVLKKTKSGELDVVASLKELMRGTSKMSEIDRAQFMTEKFGDEGAKALVPLMDKIKELEDGYKDVEKSSQNIVAKNMDDYLKLTSTRLNAAKESAYALARSLGGALAPSAITLFNFLGKVADKIGFFADKYPMLTKVIVFSAAALVGVNLLAASVLYLASGFSTLTTAIGGSIQFGRLFKSALDGVEVSAAKGGKAATRLAKIWKGLRNPGSLALKVKNSKVGDIAGKTFALSKNAATKTWLYLKNVKWDAVFLKARAAFSFVGKMAVSLGRQVVSVAAQTASLVRGKIGLLINFIKAIRWGAAIGKMKSAFIGGKAIIGGIGKAMLAMMTGPHGLMIAGIVAGAIAIGAAAYLIYKNWSKIKVFFSDLWKRFAEKFPWVAGIIKGAAMVIGGALDVIWGALKKIWEWGSKALQFLGFGGGTPKAPSGTAVTGKMKASKTSRKMPKMAKGGYVSKPTVALVGEAGDEIIVPVTDRRYGIQRLAEAAAHLGFHIAPVQNGAVEGHGRPAMQALREKTPISKIAAVTKHITVRNLGSGNNETTNKSSFAELIYNITQKLISEPAVSKKSDIIEKLQNPHLGAKAEAIGDKAAPKITYAPNYTFYGPDRENLVDVLREDKKRFKRLLEEIMHDKERVNFA